MSVTTLGPTIRALRRAAGLDQRELAARVDTRVRAQGRRGFDVTYLSKIENDRVGPPSVAALEALAIELSTDAFLLTCLAGQVPPALERLLLASPAARAFVVEALGMGLGDADWEWLRGIAEGRGGATAEEKGNHEYQPATNHGRVSQYPAAARGTISR